MQLFYDLRLGYLVETPGIETPIGDLSAKAGDIESLVLQFGRSEAADNSNSLYAAGTWTPVNLSGGSVIKLGIKEDGKYSDGEILAINAAWTQDTEAYLYLGELNLNTTAINSALARLDDDSDNDVSSLVCQLELTFQVGGVGGWRSSVRAVEIEIYHDIIGGAEGTPINADDPDQYLLKADAASTSSGYGASLIGIEDSGANFTGGTVEDALAELADAIGGGSGTVTSVAVTGSDGIEVDSGSPITTSGTIALGVNASNLKAHLSLNNVENTALSTFAGSTNITTLGTISTGTVPVANISGLGTLATQSGTFSGTSSGTNTGDNAVNSLYSGLVSNATHTGDVTGATALTIANNAVTNAKAADMAANTIKGRITGSTGDPEDLTAANVRTIINVTDGADPTGATIHAAAAKTTPVDADAMPLIDSAASNALKKVTWANIKATLKTHFDTLYNLYVLPVATTTTIGGVKRNTGGAGQYIYAHDSNGDALFGTPVAGYRPNANMIINGGFNVSQRGASFPSHSDDAYFADRWYLLRDSTALSLLTVSSWDLSGAPPSRANSTAPAGLGFKKYGFAQIIKNDSIYQAVNETVVVSFKAQRDASGGSTSLNLKAALLSWTGTADTVTSDVVSSWNSLGTTPTWAGSYTAEAVYDAGNIPTTWETYSFTAAIDTSGVNNLALFIWADNGAGSISSGFNLSDVQMEVGTSATAFQRESYHETLAKCQPYYEVIRHHSGGQGLISGLYSGTQHVHTWYYKAAKRIAPTISLGSGTSWTGGTPTITAGLDHAYFTRAAGAFIASGTSGNIALAADAEL